MESSSSNDAPDRSLHLRMIDRLFTRLLVRYGAQWLRLWDGIEIDVVKEDWSRELRGLSGEAILYALEHLPDDRPPATATAFRRLCVGRPEYFKELPAPEADPKLVARMLAEANAKAASAVASQGGPKAWAYRLKASEERGDRLTQAQRTMWRAAINDQSENAS